MGYTDKPAGANTIDSMYSQLLNDKTARNKTSYSHEEYAQFKKFFVSRNYPINDFERALKNLKDF